MSVSLTKIPVPAANAVPGSRVLFGSVPVTVVSSHERAGIVTLAVRTLAGGYLVRSYRAGQSLAAAPAHRFA